MKIITPKLEGIQFEDGMAIKDCLTEAKVYSKRIFTGWYKGYKVFATPKGLEMEVEDDFNY